MISEQGRHRLYNRLGEILGSEEAGTMIEPEMADLRTELKTEMGQFQGRMHGEMADFQTGIRSEMADFQTAIRNDIASFQTGIHNDIASFQTGIHNDTAGFRIELADLRTEIHRSARQAMAVNTAAMLAIGGMLVAALRI